MTYENGTQGHQPSSGWGPWFLHQTLALIFVPMMGLRAEYDDPFWLSPPITNTVPKDARVTLRAVAGGRDVRYVWLSNGLPVVGVTLPSLTLVATEATAAARYSVVASNAFGMSTQGVFQVRLATGSVEYYRGKAREPWNAKPNVLDLIAIGKHLRGRPSLSGLPLAPAAAYGNGTVDRADQTLVQISSLGAANSGWSASWRWRLPNQLGRRIAGNGLAECCESSPDAIGNDLFVNTTTFDWNSYPLTQAIPFRAERYAGAH